MKTLFCAVLIFSSFCIRNASAAGKGPCAADIQNYCAGVPRGGGAVLKCLKENADKLSAECKAQGEKMKSAVKEIKEACKDDMVKFCAGEKPGQGRMMKCMKAHQKDLSKTCKDEVAQKRAERRRK